MSRTEGSVFWAGFWMFVVSIVFFWLPGIGGFVAGLVGGIVAGNVPRALSAALLPALVLGAVFFLLAGALSHMFLIAVLAGLGGMLLGLLHIGALMLGAVVGGLLA